MSLFDVLINIAANTASFETGMQRVETRLGAIADIAKSAFEFAGVSLGLNELIESFESAAEAGQKLTQLSARMGASVESLSQLQYAAAATNVPFQSMTSALDILQRNLVQASEGSGKAQAAFKDLGIDTIALAAIPLPAQLDVVANKIAALPTPTQQTASAMRLLGQAGADLLPILAQGAPGIDALRQKSDDLGVTLTTLSAERLRDAKNAIDDMNASAQALWLELASDGAPAVTGFTNAVVKSMTALREMTDAKFGIGTAQSQIAGLTEQAQELGDRIDTLTARKGWFAQFFDAGLIADDEVLLEGVAKKIADIQAAAAKGSSAPLANAYDPSALQPVAVGANYLDHSIDLRQLSAVTVTATKTSIDYMKQYYDSLDTMSQTDSERTIAAWQEKTNAVHNYTQNVLESLDPANISAVVDAVSEQADRMTDINSQFLQPIEVTAKYIGGLAKQHYDEMANYAQAAAKSVQSDFATFLEDPSVKSFKAMGLAWLQTLDKMVADAAAAQLFNTLFPTPTGTSGLGGILGTFLSAVFGSGASSVDSAALGASASAGVDSAFNGLLGFANGGSFNVGGSGGVDSQLVAFKATPGENVQVGGAGGGAVQIFNSVSVTSPQVTKTDVLAAMQQTQASTVAKLQDMQRRGKFK